MFNGSIVALVTPMLATGEIDVAAFKRLIEWHIASGTQSIVVNGTTGESATLNSAERIELLKIAVETARGRIPIIAGTGTSSTATTIEETRAAGKCGVAACLVVTPYYNRPTQNGLYEHYKAIGESTDLPIIVYNVPKRTGCDLMPITLASLAHVKNIIGIKEATGDLLRVAAIKAMVKDRFILLSGDDDTALDFMAQGGQGVISVTANVAPKQMQEMCAAVLNNDYPAAQVINQQLSVLHSALMVESNPIPTKWALYKLGIIGPGIRLPLTKLSESFQSMVNDALEQSGVAANLPITSLQAVE